MNFELTDAQRELQDLMRRFVRRGCLTALQNDPAGPFARVGHHWDTDRPYVIVSVTPPGSAKPKRGRLLRAKRVLL